MNTPVTLAVSQSRKVDGKLSPTKKPNVPKSMSNERALGKDMVKDPDNPKAIANTESNLFNKHYNKELKLCEGKSSLVTF